MSPRWKLIGTFVAGAVLGGISVVQIAPLAQRTTQVAVPRGGDPNVPGVTPTGGTAPTAAPTTGPDGILPGDPAAPPPGLACEAGKNGGATAPGVTANTINLATTVVRTGTGNAFLGEVQFAMDAVKNKVNREGGICGRRLKITYVDDGWDAQKGASYLRNIIKSGVFAIPVAPSSEGLRVVIDSGDIDKANIPVVGTDGMLIDQYLHVPGTGSPQSWISSVAVATASSARIMVNDAWKRGARTFGIIFDKNYRFGAEAAAAFNAEVNLLTHANVQGYNKDNNCQKVFCGVEAAQPSYSTEVSQFNSVKPSPDFVAMFLEPTTALTWMATPEAPTAKRIPFGIGLAQPLFTRAFASNCQDACDQMQVWTSYKPPIEEYADDPLVRQFQADLRRTKNDADVFNAFSEGGYIGMQLMVDAMKRVGPFLTRDRLRAAIDELSFKRGLTIQSTLDWSPLNRFANVSMQAFTIQYKGTFGGWRTAQTVTDKNPQRGIG
jgi:ABC-type branched-subunit amino acid transport system substrate-binding protein